MIRKTSTRNRAGPVDQFLKICQILNQQLIIYYNNNSHLLMKTAQARNYNKSLVDNKVMIL